MSSQLFRIFGKDKVSGHSQLKASVQRAIRGALPAAAAAAAAASPSSVLELWQLTASCRCRPAGKIAEDYPYLVEHGLLDVILPKKQDLVLVKL